MSHRKLTIRSTHSMLLCSTTTTKKEVIVGCHGYPHVQLSWILTPHKQLHEDRCDSHCPTQNEDPDLKINMHLYIHCPTRPPLLPRPLTDRDEGLHAVGVATETGHVYGEHAPRPPPHEVGPIAGQRLGDRGMAMASSNVEGSVALFVFHVHTSTWRGRGKGGGEKGREKQEKREGQGRPRG